VDSHPIRVAVVGAGLAGLAAAWTLARRGCEVRVLERAARPGGRAAGSSEDGFAIEKAVAPLSTGDRHLCGWIHELGLAAELLPLRPVQLAQTHRGQLRAIHPETLGGVARIAGVRAWDAWRVLRFPRLMQRYRPKLRSDRPERAAELDFRGVEEFGDLYFGRSVNEQWIAPATSSRFFDDPAELSRVAFLLQWQDERNGEYGIARGGLALLVDRAAGQLPVHPGVCAHRIERSSRGAFRIAFDGSLREPDATLPGIAASELEVDAVVLATAAGEALRIARDCVSPAERDYLSQVTYGPLVLIAAALERPLTGVPVYARTPRSENSPLEVQLLEPGGVGGRAPTGCGMVSAAANERFSLANSEASDAGIERALRAELLRLYPRIGDGLRFTRVQRLPEAVPRFRVGAYRALARFQRVQGDLRAQGRRLYYAGDYLVGPRAESAVVSGQRAARALLEDFEVGA